MSRLITPALVALDADLGADASSVVAALAGRVADAGRASSADALAADVMAREATSATGLPGGIAIPHCRSEAVTEATLAFARLEPRADFGAPDGGADLVFLIAAPAGGDSDHLKLLSTLARALVRSEFTDALRAASSDDEVVALVEDVVSPQPVATPAAEGAAEVAPSAASAEGSPVRIVAVTACPTGIAHTYMAADSLVQAGERAGVDLQVETQGSSGARPLSSATIAGADAVIFATDVGVKDASRFAGKPVIVSGVKRAINEPDTMVSEAVAAAADPSAKRVDGVAAAQADESSSHQGIGLKLRQWLLTGVSYMIPFVAAGGLLIALGFLLAGYDITGEGNKIALENTIFNLPAAGEHALFGSALATYFGALLFSLGAWAFGFLVPALAGYIAYAIADRPGIAPGFVMGFLANQIGAGFLGGIVGGILAGLIAHQIAKQEAPRWLAGLMPVVIIPLVTTLVSGLLMLMVLGKPIADFSAGLTDKLNGMTGGSLILLGVILGAMMGFDLGGPVNKAAYVFATTGLTADAIAAGGAEVKIMAAVMIAGMVPPLAMALSTAVRSTLYTEAEKENGKAAWLLGAAFISEGAIPFAAADPLRVIPSMMLGSATAGAISMGAGVTLAAPHGGIFVLFAVDHVLWFLVALVVGTLVSAASVTLLKSLRVEKDSSEFEHVYTRVPVDA
ncbi:PTS system fructose-specific IIC component [Aeromicrobium sp. SORGH_AS981]|uniref:PTS fructose transporter subunit IIABC n=1 Tax=Aeromicrobium sp. SORGH_AS_0981 TaxID=3041802 RepID=UPI00285D6112|nr:fructose-specific PTS transporter subunit EIIC [Aeromicrobium sp. SORGH_AS_0981]MDR6118504.1 PTS system fructose-specific IIC component [Aeromicrobium sp. SORGH_AS_0981]